MFHIKYTVLLVFCLTWACCSYGDIKEDYYVSFYIENLEGMRIEDNSLIPVLRVNGSPVCLLGAMSGTSIINNYLLPGTNELNVDNIGSWKIKITITSGKKLIKSFLAKRSEDSIAFKSALRTSVYEKFDELPDKVTLLKQLTPYLDNLKNAYKNKEYGAVASDMIGPEYILLWNGYDKSEISEIKTNMIKRLEKSQLTWYYDKKRINCIIGKKVAIIYDTEGKNGGYSLGVQKKSTGESRPAPMAKIIKTDGSLSFMR